MISLKEALQKIIDNTPVLNAIEIELLDALGYVLAEDVISDIDIPPFDKSAMDGYALRAADVEQAPVKLRIIEEIAAGIVPEKKIGPGQCAEIMTGAPVPEGADAVVMVEHTQKDKEKEYAIIERTIEKGKNICFKAEETKKGRIVLDAGQWLMPHHIGILASVGKSHLKVIRKPTFAVITTGSEIVEVDQIPAPGQIRNSNGYSLQSQIRQAGYRARYLGASLDEPESLKRVISSGLADDIVLLSGGVSMGNYDLVPQVLKDIGAEIIFHNIAIKPGKPALFAKLKHTLIFGVPGNPVATMVGFDKLILPPARKMAGEKVFFRPIITATLTKDLKVKTGRLGLRHARISYRDGKYLAEAAATHGSADLLSTSQSNGIILVPADVACIKAGDAVQIELWDTWWKSG